MIEFKLPSLGADMDEGKLLEWRIKPGDAVKRGQVIAVVDTSKAAVDVETWQEGVVSELLTQPGETIAVGTVMARLDGAAAEAPRSTQGAKPVEAKPVEALRPPQPAPAAAPETQRRRISPAARKHAAEKGIDLDRIIGTGPQGAVTVEDVEQAAGQREAKAETARVEQPKVAEKALEAKSVEKPAAATGRILEMRKAIAAAMSRSKREIPHYYLSQTIPMQRASEWLAAQNARRPITGRLLMAVLQLKAVALALADFPDLNGFYRDGAYQPSAQVHVGVAISLRQGGLVAPAIHDVAELPLDELMRALADLVRRARAGSLRSSEMSDPTITLSNLGEGGVESVYPIIYPPQVAIVGYGALAQRPWVAPDGGLHVAPTVVASLGADHRVSDGHRGALFLAELARRLQEPETL
jgi:pyruvate dehydrogenase E2 component (dihydrolipoamide acetyltransferase)